MVILCLVENVLFAKECIAKHSGLLMDQVKLLACCRKTQKSHQVPKSVVQTFLELRQAWCYDHFPWEPDPVLNNSLGEKRFPDI